MDTNFYSGLRVDGKAETSAQGTLMGSANSVTVMPAASTSNEGVVVLYVGETSGNYTKDTFYKCTSSRWVALDIGGGSNIVDGVVDGTIKAQGDGTYVVNGYEGLEHRVEANEDAITNALSRVSATEQKDSEQDSKLVSMESTIGTLSSGLSSLQSDLTKYYLKTETYSREEVNNLVSTIPKFKVSIVSSLPGTGENATIYLVPKGGSGSDVHDEYIWTGSKFELIGSTAVDLSDYYTKTQTDAQVTNAEVTGGTLSLSGSTVSLTLNKNKGNVSGGSVALGAASTKGVSTSVTANDANLITGGAVKSYVDSAISTSGGYPKIVRVYASGERDIALNTIKQAISDGHTNIILNGNKNGPYLCMATELISAEPLNNGIRLTSAHGCVLFFGNGTSQLSFIDSDPGSYVYYIIL